MRLLNPVCFFIASEAFVILSRVSFFIVASTPALVRLLYYCCFVMTIIAVPIIVISVSIIIIINLFCSG